MEKPGGMSPGHMLRRILRMDGVSDLSMSCTDLLVCSSSSVARLSTVSSKSNSPPWSLLILLRLAEDIQE